MSCVMCHLSLPKYSAQDCSRKSTFRRSKPFCCASCQNMTFSATVSKACWLQRGLGYCFIAMKWLKNYLNADKIYIYQVCPLSLPLLKNETSSPFFGISKLISYSTKLIPHLVMCRLLFLSMPVLSCTFAKLQFCKSCQSCKSDHGRGLDCWQLLLTINTASTHWATGH